MKTKSLLLVGAVAIASLGLWPGEVRAAGTQVRNNAAGYTIGTTANQTVGFHGSTPVAQRSGTAQAAVVASDLKYVAFAGRNGTGNITVPGLVAGDALFRIVALDGATANGTNATLTTALTGAQNDLVFTAAAGLGDLGNALTVAYTATGNNSTLTASKSGNAITVALATNATGTIITNATQVRDLVNATATVNASLTAALAGGNDGSGNVTALSDTALTGGADAGFTPTISTNATLVQTSAENRTSRIFVGIFNHADLVTLLNELRGALVEKGLIKGSE